MKQPINQLKIVTIGGGTGQFTLISALKKVVNPENITAVTTVFDNGGHSGIMRNELGVLPPGDSRQCLVALAQPKNQALLSSLLSFRIPKITSNNGRLAGENIGNIIISALELQTGDQEKALFAAKNIFQIPGRILPVSLTNTTLMAQLSNGNIIEGETEIDLRFKQPDYDPSVKIERLYTKEIAYLNPSVVTALQNADYIFISAGDLYTSILPHFIVNDFPEAICNTDAKIIYIGNLMTKPGETDGFKISDYIREFYQYTKGCRFEIDALILNDNHLPKQALYFYKQWGQVPVEFDSEICRQLLPKCKFLTQALSRYLNKEKLIRHDVGKLSKAIKNYLLQTLPQFGDNRNRQQPQSYTQ